MEKEDKGNAVQGDCETIRKVKEMARKYMARYNYDRDHQGLDDVTPSLVYFSRNENTQPSSHKMEGGFILKNSIRVLTSGDIINHC